MHGSKFVYPRIFRTGLVAGLASCPPIISRKLHPPEQWPHAEKRARIIPVVFAGMLILVTAPVTSAQVVDVRSATGSVGVDGSGAALRAFT
jgi:hypothetical protein